MTRTLDGHKGDPTSDLLEITVLDQPGVGGASSEYEIRGPNFAPIVLHFQKGLPSECGVNGLTNEALLAILIDRLYNFQAGPFANEYTGRALAHFNYAKDALNDRARDRVLRGVEGTHQV